MPGVAAAAALLSKGSVWLMMQCVSSFTRVYTRYMAYYVLERWVVVVLQFPLSPTSKTHTHTAKGQTFPGRKSVGKGQAEKMYQSKVHTCESELVGMDANGRSC